jgi:hypothetical protein
LFSSAGRVRFSNTRLYCDLFLAALQLSALDPVCPYVFSILAQNVFAEAELAHYQPSLVVEELPYGWSADQYVAKVESGETLNMSMPLAASLQSFLEGDQRVMVMLGEPGVGKSSFLRRVRGTLLQTVRPGPNGVALRGPGEACDPPWTPLLIELKEHRTSELRGLLLRYLAIAGLSSEDVEQLRLVTLRGASGGYGRDGSGKPCLPFRLLVLCDGFDELQGEDDVQQDQRERDRLRDLLATMQGGPIALWGHGTVKLVVTSRESRLGSRGEEAAVFGLAYSRAHILPFNAVQVRQSREELAIQSPHLEPSPHGLPFPTLIPPFPCRSKPISPPGAVSLPKSPPTSYTATTTRTCEPGHRPCRTWFGTH